MFERTRIDNMARAAVPCELVMSDGRELTGNLLVTPPRGIIEELNAAGGFVEFEAYDRSRTFVSKGDIRSAKSSTVPKLERPDQRIREGQPLDPYAVLRISKTADRDTIRKAYHELAKAYHPDRLQAIELPPEIVDYATAMAKRINAAYSALAQQTPPAAARTA